MASTISPALDPALEHYQSRSTIVEDENENENENDNINNNNVNNKSSSRPRRGSIACMDLTFATRIPSLCTLPASESIRRRSLHPPNITQYTSPYEWPLSRKAPIMFISCAATMFASVGAGSYGPALNQLMAYFHVASVPVYIGITMFTAGFAIGPMPLSPFSEIRGRKPVFVATAVLFLVCHICTAVTRSYPG